MISVMRFLAVLALLLFLPMKPLLSENFSSPETRVFSFSEKRDLEGESKGYATLSVVKMPEKGGRKIALNVHFFALSGGGYFFNPFLKGLIPKPCALALYGSNRKFILDLLAWTDGSQITVSRKDWVLIPASCGVDVSFEVLLRDITKNIPPGDYYLQMIYFRAFMAKNPFLEDENSKASNQSAIKDFYQHFDRSELFRSNIVKVHLEK